MIYEITEIMKFLKLNFINSVLCCGFTTNSPNSSSDRNENKIIEVFKLLVFFLHHIKSRSRTKHKNMKKSSITILWKQW